MTTDIKDCLPECISKFQDDGFAIVDAGLDSGALFELGTLLDTKHPGERNLLHVSAVSQLARSETIHKLVSPLLGDNFFAVPAFFSTRPKKRTGKWLGIRTALFQSQGGEIFRAGGHGRSKLVSTMFVPHRT